MVDQSPFFYGWIIVAASTFAMVMTTPGQTLGVSVFLDHIIEDLGITRSLVSLFYTAGTLVGSFMLPYVGRQIDRKGPRLAVVVITLLFAGACVWMGFVSGPVTLLIGFLFVRGFGQGSLSLVSNYTVNIWFIRYRGLAVGFLGLGYAAASGFFPYLIEILIRSFGWRGAYIILGALVAVTMIPVGYLFFRSHPERYGLHPDGIGPGHKDHKDHPGEISGYTAGEARRTVTFWIFAAGDFLLAALGTGLVFHHFSIMETGGIDRLAATAFFAAMGLASAGGNIVAGYLMDRVPPRFLLSATQVLQAAALFFAVQVSGYLSILIYGSIVGLAMGTKNGVIGSVHAYYFGRAHIGSIRGFASTLSVIGSAVGPFLFASGYDLFGSYNAILYVSAFFPLTVALVAFRIKPFKPDGSVF